MHIKTSCYTDWGYTVVKSRVACNSACPPPAHDAPCLALARSNSITHTYPGLIHVDADVAAADELAIDVQLHPRPQRPNDTSQHGDDKSAMQGPDPHSTGRASFIAHNTETEHTHTYRKRAHMGIFPQRGHRNLVFQTRHGTCGIVGQFEYTLNPKP